LGHGPRGYPQATAEDDGRHLLQRLRSRVGRGPTPARGQRLPCPRCGSLARRFNVTATVVAHVSVEATAQIAGGVGEALPPTIRVEESRSGRAIGQQRTDGWATGVRGPRRITNHLVLVGRSLAWTGLIEPPTDSLALTTRRSLWWIQLTERPTWMVEVVDEAGELLSVGVGDDPVEALVGVAEHLLPDDAGLSQVMVVDEAGEVLATGIGDDPIEALAAVAEFVLPGHPG
jgi:hypothetical protein